VVYTYAPGRSADHAVSLLKDFSGVLTTDGYQVYQSLAKARDDVVLAHCWAHARRKFFDLAKSLPPRRRGADRRPSPPKPWRASARSTPSRPKSAAKARRFVSLPAPRKARR
jgi:transposase